MSTIITAGKNKAVALAQVQAFIAGTQKHFPNGSRSRLRERRIARQRRWSRPFKAWKTPSSLSLRRKARSHKDALTALQNVEATVGPLMRDYKRFVEATFNTATPELADFGLQAPKAPTPLRHRETCRRRHREDEGHAHAPRGTTSRKQKLAVKGNVTGVLMTPVTSAPVSSPVAPTAPASSAGDAYLRPAPFVAAPK